MLKGLHCFFSAWEGTTKRRGVFRCRREGRSARVDAARLSLGPASCSARVLHKVSQYSPEKRFVSMVYLLLVSIHALFILTNRAAITKVEEIQIDV